MGVVAREDCELAVGDVVGEDAFEAATGVDVLEAATDVDELDAVADDDDTFEDA